MTSGVGCGRPGEPAAKGSGEPCGFVDEALKQLEVLVLAAGRSTRLATVTGGRPKPLCEIEGEAVLARNLRWLGRTGITSVCINLHYRPELIQQQIGDGIPYGVRVNYSLEREILGTAGAVAALPEAGRRRLLVVYGDNLLNFDLRAMLGEHLVRGAEFTLAAFDPARNANTGIAGGRLRTSAEGRMAGFAEVRGGEPEDGLLVNAGVYLLEKGLAGEIPAGFSDFATDWIPRWLEEGRDLRVHLMDGYCLGMDTPVSLEKARQMARDGRVALA